MSTSIAGSSINTGTRRTAWMAARARNAAKRGGLIASVGILAVATTLLLLILVPREVNRTVRARIDALPPIVDTLPLQANFTGAMDRLKNAEATLQLLLQADADRVASATSNNDIAPAPNAQVASSPTEQTDARKDLATRVSRARTAQLVENFRAVGEAELLRTDARARITLDSLNSVSRDREAYAALGGPDARYAAMTAKITSLGQRLLVIADQRLASTAAINATRPTLPEPFTPQPVPDSAKAQSVAPAVPTVDTGTLAPTQRYSGDSTTLAARHVVDSAKALLQSAEKTLADARASNVRIAEERKRAEADSPARVPPLAMLIAALVTGLAVGFGVAFFFEVRRPRVADVAEVERVTDARVILHTGSTRAERSQHSRGQADAALPNVIDTASESYQLLHVTLTGYGDTSREVQVISSDALLSATIGINLAAAAVRDSRATLLVDVSTPPRIVSRLLKQPSGSATGFSKASLATQVTPAKLGRDLSVDTLSLSGEVSNDTKEQLQDIAHDHDFTVVVRSDNAEGTTDSPLPATDVILCARVGVTRLDWLTSQTAELRATQHRVRAVLLWSTRAPSFR